MKRVHLIAGSFREASFYAEQQRLPADGWTYVVRAEQLRGLCGADIRHVGQSYLSPLWRYAPEHEIEALIQKARRPCV